MAVLALHSACSGRAGLPLLIMVSVSAREATSPGRRVSYRGHDYVAYEQKGFRTVSWSDGQAVYGLVSMLDYDALFECADRLGPSGRDRPGSSAPT